MVFDCFTLSIICYLRKTRMQKKLAHFVNCIFCLFSFKKVGKASIQLGLLTNPSDSEQLSQTGPNERFPPYLFA
jgi:hypothetical protein